MLNFYKLFKIVSLFLLLSILVNANETDAINIDTLLQDIEKKSDLSEKTKLENSGVSFIYTREDIDRMQARYLKDILKSATPFGYKENRYGLSDPNGFSASLIPFASSQIKLFIDNQEITTGLYGSGISTHGDIDIGFVDHIEIYTYSPTYEFTTEPTFMLVKLYSKNASRDEGGKIELNIGNYGASRVSGYYASELDNEWSYLLYGSYNNDIRKKYTSHDTEFSRDKKVAHIFASFQNENHRILLDATTQDRDTFIGLSLDATGEKNRAYGNSIHLGYDANINNFSYLISYMYGDIDTQFKDNVTPIPTPPFYSLFPVATYHTKSDGYVFTTELKYKYITSNNKTIIGGKYRFKDTKTTLNILNNIDINYFTPANGEKYQEVLGAFIENQYSLNDNSIITLGAQITDISNKYSEQDDTLYMFRLGYTFTTDTIISKTLIQNIDMALDPYLINNQLYITPGVKEPQSTLAFVQDFIYQKENNTYEFIFSFGGVDNYLLPNKTDGRLDTYDDSINIIMAEAHWTLEYNDYDKLFCNFRYQKATQLPDDKDFSAYFSTIRSLNTIRNFDIFNEIIYERDSAEYKDYFDYSAGVIYHIDKDISLSVKGENILNSAKTISYNRINPSTFKQESPLLIAPIDQTVTVSFEYLF